MPELTTEDENTRRVCFHRFQKGTRICERCGLVLPMGVTWPPPAKKVANYSADADLSDDDLDMILRHWQIG